MSLKCVNVVSVIRRNELSRPLELNSSPIKCVLVGDSDVGKTSLIMTYTTNNFPGKDVRNVVDISHVDLMVDGKSASISIWDTAGQEDYDTLRPLAYPETDVFLLCFSIANHTSFQHVSDRYYPEIRRHCPNAPIILVGTKIDLRNDDDTYRKLERRQLDFIDASMGFEKLKEISGVKYHECSALTQSRVKELFDEVFRTAFLHHQQKLKNQQFDPCLLL